MQKPQLDVLILGAGLSGIGMACHLERACKGQRYALIERRQAIGGTWDLFRYPGIRSDSDMFTFGYHFKPWTGLKTLADGPSIRRYVQETAEEYGVTQHIRFGKKAVAAAWSSSDGYWTVTVVDEASGQQEAVTARFLIGCTGYYNYDAGYQPDFPNQAAFKGQLVHPQHWPQGLDYRGKRVVIIGSGATAITLVPSMAADAGHVTMLQRSPSYVLALPSFDGISAALAKVLPMKWVYAISRKRNVLVARTLYKTARARPKAMRRLLLAQVKAQLKGKSDMRHFTPSYNPWEERLCVVPDGDLFTAIRSGKASVVTDHIEAFEADGIRLKSGEFLPADIIVSATGLDLQLLGKMPVTVDGKQLALNETLVYKGVLVEGVPNLGFIFGYTNISWTLKADIAAAFFCRLLKHMKRSGKQVVVPRDHIGAATEHTILGSLQAGYIRRAAAHLPRQGRRAPWQVTQDYDYDRKDLAKASLDDGILEYR